MEDLICHEEPFGEKQRCDDWKQAQREEEVVVKVAEVYIKAAAGGPTATPVLPPPPRRGGQKRARTDQEDVEHQQRAQNGGNLSDMVVAAQDTVRARERTLLRYYDPLLTAPHLLPATPAAAAGRGGTAQSSNTITRAIAVQWILELGLDHWGQAASNSSTPTSAINDFAEVPVMLHPDEMLNAAALAVSYWDALMDGSRAAATLSLPVPCPRGTVEGAADMFQIAALACYVAACKFTLLDDADGTQALRNAAKFLTSGCLQLPSDPILAAAAKKEVKRALIGLELHLWDKVLHWRGWRPTAVTWLHDASRHFALPTIASLMFALPVLMLDAPLSRTVFPSELALCLVLLSSVEVAASGDDTLCLFFLGGAGAAATTGDNQMRQQLPEDGGQMRQRQRKARRSMRLQQIMARIGNILRLVIQQQTGDNSSEQLPQPQLWPSGWNNWFVQESTTTWKSICLKCNPGLPALFPYLSL